jgi:hypothetical protein
MLRLVRKTPQVSDRSTDQVDAHFFHELRPRRPHEERPVVFVVILRFPDKFVLVAYQDHEPLYAVLSHSRPPLDLFFHMSLCVRFRVSGRQLRSECSVRRRSGVRPAHWAIRLEIIGGIIIWVEIGKGHVCARMLDGAGR